MKRWLFYQILLWGDVGMWMPVCKVLKHPRFAGCNSSKINKNMLSGSLSPQQKPLNKSRRWNIEKPSIYLTWHIFKMIWTFLSGQIIMASYDITPKGSWGREIPLFQQNLGHCNLARWLCRSLHIYITCYIIPWNYPPPGKQFYHQHDEQFLGSGIPT